MKRLVPVSLAEVVMTLRPFTWLLASWFLCGQAALAAVGAAEERKPTGTSIILSEGFEKGREAWQPTRMGGIDAQLHHGGKCSLRLADESDADYFMVSRIVPVKPNSVYEISFWTFSRDAEHACLCVAQHDEKMKTVVSNGKRQIQWHWPFRERGSLGRWVLTSRRFTTARNTVKCRVYLNPASASPKNTGRAWFDDISLKYVGAPVKPVERAEKSLPLKPLPPLVLDLGAKDCAVLCPRDAALQAAASRLAAAVERRARRRPRIVADAADPGTLGSGPLLVMGNLTTGAAARTLYFTGYDFTDCAWPGKGGTVVRTIRDPFGTRAHVLMIGGSSREDIARAADKAAEIIAQQGPKLHYINDVRLGQYADLIKGWTTDLLKPDVRWKKKGTSDAWQYLHQVGRAAMGYLRTGETAYLDVWKREMSYFLDYSARRMGQGKRLAAHSLIDASFVPWDLFADHPSFTRADRRVMDEQFLRFACSAEGPRPLAKARPRIRENHGAGRALDAYWFGRYFWRRYRVPEAKEWMATADRFFASQMPSSKPCEDSYYYQFRGTLLCTLMHALAADKKDYLQSRALREAVERSVIVARTGRGASAYFGAYAAVTNDPGYLSTFAHAGKDAYIQYCAKMRDGHLIGENLRAFCAFEAPKENQRLLGVFVAPLDPQWHQMRSGGSAWNELVVTTKPEESYDKLVIRDSFSPDAFHLIMDGLYNGGHSFPDANCITMYRERGQSWLRQGYGRYGPTCSTVRQQNGVFVALNGQGPNGAHTCAQLLYVRRLADDLHAVASALTGLGHVQWQRHLLRKKDAWTLVVDRTVAEKPGEIWVERHWRLMGDVTARPHGLVSRQGKSALHLQSAGLPPGRVSGDRDRAEIVRANMPAGGFIDIATLICVDGKPAHTRYTLTQTREGWRVLDTRDNRALGVAFEQSRLVLSPDAAEAAAAAAPETLPLRPPARRIELPWRRVEVGGEITAVAVGPDCIAAGTRNGTVTVVGLNGTKRWQAKVETWVLALHFVANDLLAGEDNGTICRLNPTGRKEWSHTIPYVPIGYPHWSDQKSRIREITTADITGDGNPEILLANGDRRLYAFTGSGAPMWKKEIQWGNLTALTPTTYLGKFALFAGTTRPTLVGRVKIYDANGAVVGRLSTTRMLRQQIRDVRLFDLTGDGRREIVVARDINSNQIAVCDESRQVIWKTDVGGSPDAIAIREYRGATQVLCGTRGRYVHALDGVTGKPLWFRYLGDEPRMLWTRPDGTILALCPSGSVFVLSGDGELLGCDTLASPISALLRAGEHRVDARVLPVGTEGGVLYVLHRAE